MTAPLENKPDKQPYSPAGPAVAPGWAACFWAAGRRAADIGLLRARLTKPAPEPLKFNSAELTRPTVPDTPWGRGLMEALKTGAVPFYGHWLGGQATEAPEAPEKTPPASGRPLGGEHRVVLDFWGRTIALAHGAALVGVAPLKEEFFYERTVDSQGRERQIIFQDRLPDDVDWADPGRPLIVPRQECRVLILAFQEAGLTALNGGSLDNTSKESALDSRKQAVQALKVARYFNRRGYVALPSAGGLMVLPPLAVWGGLGQAGRHGLLITPEYGPGLRLFGIVTDWPFELDQAVDFGVEGYCGQCRQCLDGCPAKAVPTGPPTWSAAEAWGEPVADKAGNQPGGHKWYVNQAACFEYWLKTGASCRICLDVCPYLKEPLWCAPGLASPAQRRGWADLLLTYNFAGPFISHEAAGRPFGPLDEVPPPSRPTWPGRII